MNLEITGKSLDITPKLRELTEKKVAKLSHHSDKIMNVHIVYSVTKNTHNAQAHVTLAGGEVNAHADSGDMYKTIDLLIPKLVTQLEKHKEKH